jgi:hypothetical protein
VDGSSSPSRPSLLSPVEPFILRDKEVRVPSVFRLPFCLTTPFEEGHGLGLPAHGFLLRVAFTFYLVTGLS